MRFGFSIGLLVLGLMASPALAQTDGVIRGHLYAGTNQAGLEAMVELGPDDPAAAFGAGLFRFLTGIEDFAQALNRHGFAPGRGILVSPLLGVGAPDAGTERTIAPLSYTDMRGYLEDFVSAMDEARGLLVEASQSDGFAVEIDLVRLRIDIGGEEPETAGMILAEIAGLGQQLDLTDTLDTPPEAVFAFDVADALWLAGYSQVLAAQVDFALAHDFSDFFHAFMHRLFPGAGLPMDVLGSQEAVFMDPATDHLLADAIAAIHTLNWPVIDPARLADVRERVLGIFDLSRRHWAATLAETDDHLEFIPGPHQTPVFPEMAVSKDMVKAWLETLEAAERVVEGELLLPHWRFGGVGFDLKSYFESAERTDLVLLVTGLDALPFLREGPIASEEDFEAANRVFGDAIWGYALWFN